MGTNARPTSARNAANTDSSNGSPVPTSGRPISATPATPLFPPASEAADPAAFAGTVDPAADPAETNPTAPENEATGENPQPTGAAIQGDVWQPVSFKPSTNIAAVWWNAAQKKLRVEFWRGGRTYVYHQVDAQTVSAFSQAASSGRFFDTFIRGQFEYDETG